MMKIHKITMMVKRVQYQEVEFSSTTGCDMPKNANDLLGMCEEIKNDPLSNCDTDNWISEDEQPEITSFNVEEVNKPE